MPASYFREVARYGAPSGGCTVTSPVYAVLASQTGESSDETTWQTVAREMGTALAKRGCSIAVYSCSDAYLDKHVVSGFVEGAKDGKGAARIHLWYSTGTNDASFPECLTAGTSELFKHHAQASNDWGAVFFKSMAEVDGVVIIGGNDFAFVAGLWALQVGAPTVPVAHFGGAGQKVWRVLSADPGLSTQDELGVMGETWQASTPTRMAEIAKRQYRVARRHRVRASKAQDRNVFWGLVLLSALVLCLLLPFVPITAGSYYPLLVVSPVIAGACGAGLRYIWDADAAPSRTYAQALLLGAGAGLIYVTVFWINQASADDVLFDTAEELTRNRAFILLLSTIAVGLGAGFAVDVLFRRLRDQEPSDATQ